MMDRAGSELELTADQQIARMADQYPGFAVLHSTSWIILWRGGLTPYARRYEVQLTYSAVSMTLANIRARTVHVEVVEPVLGRRSNHPAVPIPHTYTNWLLPARPRLCLHTMSEWTSAMYIADTIVPWTVEWLAAYEGWRATGTWYAGGHGSEREDLPQSRRGRR